MIISHKNKFIFIKTEKTAGTSIEIALSKFCGPDDIITPIDTEGEKLRKELKYRGPQNFLYKFNNYSKLDWGKFFLHRKWQGFYNHISLKEIRKHIHPNIWEDYYTFCFERNPWDKVISWYFWVGQKYDSITDFILSGRAGEVRGFDLYSEGGIIQVNKIGKFEDLSNDLKKISDDIGLSPSIELPKKKTKSNIRTNKKHYSKILTDKEASLISKIFAREIAYFNYKY